MLHAFKIGADLHELWLSRANSNYELHYGESCVPIKLHDQSKNHIEIEINNHLTRVHLAILGDEIHLHHDGEAYTLSYIDNLKRFSSQAHDQADMVSRAPMPGAVIAIAVQSGQEVQRGDVLVVIESMKMETAICATVNGVVQDILVQLGQTFERDAVLVTLTAVKVPA